MYRITKSFPGPPRWTPALLPPGVPGRHVLSRFSNDSLFFPPYCCSFPNSVRFSNGNLSSMHDPLDSFFFPPSGFFLNSFCAFCIFSPLDRAFFLSRFFFPFFFGHPLSLAFPPPDAGLFPTGRPMLFLLVIHLCRGPSPSRFSLGLPQVENTSFSTCCPSDSLFPGTFPPDPISTTYVISFLCELSSHWSGARPLFFIFPPPSLKIFFFSDLFQRFCQITAFFL